MGYNILMAIIVMLGWWYSQGWLWIIDITRQRLQTISRTFAVTILLKTWFAPWKQIYEPSTFRNFFRIAVDNAVSRFIGGIVRTIILFWALILSILVLAVGVVSIVIWPLLPIATLLCIVFALSGVSL